MWELKRGSLSQVRISVLVVADSEAKLSNTLGLGKTGRRERDRLSLCTP